jgi:hypothetical protein
LIIKNINININIFLENIEKQYKPELLKCRSWFSDYEKLLIDIYYACDDNTIKEILKKNRVDNGNETRQVLYGFS